MPRFIPSLPSDRRHFPLVIALIVAFITLVMVLYVTHSAAKVDGQSMEPTLHNRERILITKGSYTPVRGDIISFHVVLAGKPDTLIKRIVALPGDLVEIRGDRAYVNGAEAPSDAVALVGSEQISLGPFTVPAGTVYVLGDNRPVSLDSRFIGPIPVTDIQGRVAWVFSPVTRLRRIDSVP